LALLFVGFGLEGRAVADLTINTPVGLTAGDTFRIPFVTDGVTSAQSLSIATYNTFVSQDATNEAGGGSVTYYGTTLTWSAIASAGDESAIPNIGETGAPIYLASGTLVTPTDNSSGLWSGNLTNPLDQDLNGILFPTGLVWTGTLADGTAAPSEVLGTGHPEVGAAAATNNGWVAETTQLNFATLRLYGMMADALVRIVQEMGQVECSDKTRRELTWSCRELLEQIEGHPAIGTGVVLPEGPFKLAERLRTMRYQFGNPDEVFVRPDVDILALAATMAIPDQGGTVNSLLAAFSSEHPEFLLDPGEMARRGKAQDLDHIALIDPR